MRKLGVSLSVLAGSLAANIAAAQQESVAEEETINETTSKGYVSILPYYLSVDGDRGAVDAGRGLSIAYGREWRGGWFWELQTFGNVIDTVPGGAPDDYQYGAGLDVGYRFVQGPGPSPFVILGAGAVRNDVLPDSEDDTDFIGNVGLGFVSNELGRGGVRIRGEARYVRDDFETTTGREMNEWRIGLGVTVPLGRKTVERQIVRERVVTEQETVTVPAEIVDSDNDGVPGQIDDCPNTLAGLATDNRGCATEAGQTLRLEGVNFETNSAQLTQNAAEILREVAGALRSDPNLRAEIAGHTDSTGDDGYNMRLSQQRAEAVRDFLVRQGVEAGRLEARGYGETRPVADNGTETGRALNRRVEFRVLD